MSGNSSDSLLEDAIRERALVYLALYRELSGRYGRDEAIDVMRSAIYRHGRVFGESLQACAPDNFAGLFEGFAKAPDNGATFSPKAWQLDDQCLDVQMMTCPLKAAWIEAGCNDEEVCDLLNCASAIDEGTLDAAGFEHEIKLWSPGESGCCRLRITAKRR